MDPLWNPWTAMALVGALAALCAWIESKRKPVHERIAPKTPKVVEVASGASVSNPELIKVEAEEPTEVNTNTSEQKRKRQQRQSRNRRRKDRSRN